ncbi:hypothetical protein BD626DRAFT_502368 [Schizophyllum amplum]|uniref:Uncharacterized protein n=1 Tax=Schizophyllum amplum TaxID=97359 RepID=A0A550C9A7_9AGAR|nr:hypothetical protein BD626DRAFT_502368 [Auriculariopsis ampla]
MHLRYVFISVPIAHIALGRFPLVRHVGPARRDAQAKRARYWARVRRGNASDEDRSALRLARRARRLVIAVGRRRMRQGRSRTQDLAPRSTDAVRVWSPKSHPK